VKVLKLGHYHDGSEESSTLFLVGFVIPSSVLSRRIKVAGQNAGLESPARVTTGLKDVEECFSKDLSTPSWS